MGNSMNDSACTDPELYDWLRWASEGGKVPSFMPTVAEAALLACLPDYAPLRTVEDLVKLWESKQPRGKNGMKELAFEIYTAVRSGKLVQPFNAAMVRAACPGWATHTYLTFLGKHAVGNPGHETEHFVRVARGSYKLRHSAST